MATKSIAAIFYPQIPQEDIKHVRMKKCGRNKKYVQTHTNR